MFNTKKKRLTPEEQRKANRGLLKRNNGCSCLRPVRPKMESEGVWRTGFFGEKHFVPNGSKEDVLNTPASIRNGDIPADYFDVIPDGYYLDDEWDNY